MEPMKPKQKIYPDWTRLDEWLDKPDDVDDRER